MDSESHHILSLFQSGNYRALTNLVANESTTPFSLLFQARAYLALTPPNTKQALQLLTGLDSLDAKALREFCNFLNGKEDSLEDLEEMMLETEEQLEQSELPQSGQPADGTLIKTLLATGFILKNERLEEAIEILLDGINSQNSDCLGLLTHLYNSLSLSHKANSLLTSPSTTTFTADSLFSQLLLAQTYLHLGPTSAYQKAFYTFDEIKSSPVGRTQGILNSVGVTQALLGRWEEAESAFLEGKALTGEGGDCWANEVVVGLHCGQSLGVVEGNYLKLKSAAPKHPLVVSMEAKSLEFDAAAAKFGITV